MPQHARRGGGLGVGRPDLHAARIARRVEGRGLSHGGDGRSDGGHDQVRRTAAYDHLQLFLRPAAPGFTTRVLASFLMAVPRPRQTARRATQNGQAIVLSALMLTVLIGMAAIAIDGARAYSVRRDLQSAIDAAALAGGGRVPQGGGDVSAEQAPTNVVASNLRLYNA